MANANNQKWTLGRLAKAELIVVGCGLILLVPFMIMTASIADSKNQAFIDSSDENGKILAPLSKIWDAGIVFSDERFTIAFPLNEPSVTRAAQVVGITTSCECSTAIARDYVDQLGNQCVAIKITIQERELPSRKELSMNLTLQVRLQLEENQIISRDIRVLLSG